MAKNSKDVYEAEAKTSLLLFDPDKLTIVEDDETHPLYDERASLEVSESLVLNIMQYGILQPIVVRKNAESGDVEVVAGRRRTRACREANKRLKKSGAEVLRIPGTIKRGENHTFMGVMISENEHREGDPPILRAKKLARYLETGRTEQDATVTFGISIGTIKNLLALLDAPKAVQSALDRGVINASEAYKLAKMAPADARAKVKQLATDAPRTEKGKRPRKSAKKAREIVSGVESSTVRSAKEIEKKRDEIANSLEYSGYDQKIMDAVFAYVLGADEELLLEFRMAGGGAAAPMPGMAAYINGTAKTVDVDTWAHGSAETVELPDEELEQALEGAE